MTSLAAAGLLLRYYLARRTPLLLWSCTAFAALAVNNVLVFTDLVLFPDFDLSFARACVGMAGMVVLLFGLIWEGV